MHEDEGDLPYIGGPGMRPEVLKNIQDSRERQRRLERGELDPTRVNEDAALSDPAGAEIREARAERKAALDAIRTGSPYVNATWALREVILELCDRVGVLEAIVGRRAQDAAVDPVFIPDPVPDEPL